MFFSPNSYFPQDDYSSTYDYDLRGNITSITRNGMDEVNGGYVDKQIDNLTLAPYNGTNRLKTVTDNAHCPTKKSDSSSLR